MPRFTDEQVEAACEKFKRLYPLTGFGREFPESMRSVLAAAAEAAPAMDTTEFEASLREFGARSRLAHGGYLVGNKERENEFNALAEKTFSRLLDMFREAAR